MRLRPCPKRGVRSTIPQTSVFRHTDRVSALVIGYARTSLFGEDAEAQRVALVALGAPPDRVYLDAGLVGMTRPRPALREAVAALRGGDTLAVTALVRLARSSADAAEMVRRLIELNVTLDVDGYRFLRDDNGLRLLAEGLEVAAQRWSVAHSRSTREGLRAARTRGQLKGRGPKMNPIQERFVVKSFMDGRFGAADLGELFGVSRSTVYRALRRAERASAQRPTSRS